MLIPLLASASLAWAEDDCQKIDVPATAGVYIRTFQPEAFASSPDAPEPESTMEMIREGMADHTVTLMMLKTTQPSIRWIGLEWGGPISGLLMAVDCQGHVMGGAIGGIEKIEKGPSIPALGESVLVSYIDGTGTGYLHKSYSLYAIKGNKLIELWTHELEASDFEMPSESGRDAKYLPTFGKGYDKFNVEGTIENYVPVKQTDGSMDLEDKASKVEHQKETYCWDEKKEKYSLCKS